MVVSCTASLGAGACVLCTGDESAHGPKRARRKLRSPLAGRLVAGQPFPIVSSTFLDDATMR
jgi:hypothetical protein